MPTQNQNPCPCGSASYTRCCERFHSGTELPPSAEALMRSRYSAYVLNLHDYLLETWHPTTRPARSVLHSDGTSTRWLGLSVKKHAITGDNSAIVAFTARYKPAGSGKAERLEETSRFVREDGRWFYVDGDISD